MGMLHETLAVIGDLTGKKDVVFKETLKIFKDKHHLFSGEIKTLEMFDEERKQEEVSEQTEMATTVMARLEYTSKSFINFWDAKIQKESANQKATADVLVNEQIILKAVPVTFLLEMENELANLRKVYMSIPTQKQDVEWEEDTSSGKHHFKAKHSKIALRSEKKSVFKTIAEATKEHPAQVKEVMQTRAIGRYITKQWTGTITPAKKAMMLERLDTIRMAIKKARQVANRQKVEKLAVGQTIFTFINKGISNAL